MSFNVDTVVGRGLHELANAGDAIAAWVVSMNVWVAALFVLAFALDRMLASRVSAAWRLLLYAPIALRLLVPGGWVLSIPTEAAPVVLAAESNVVTLAAPSVDNIASLAVANPSHSVALPWTVVVPAVYAIGVMLLSFRWWRERRRVNELLRASSEAPTWIRELAIGQLGLGERGLGERGLGERGSGEVRRGFDVVEHPSSGPLLIGTRQPRLVLPAGLAERIGERGVRAVVMHEASHVRRRDPMLAAALHVAVVLAWPIVAVWCAAARVRTLIEIACDERALAGADFEARRSYGQALIELATPRVRSVVALGFGDALYERVASLRLAKRRWSTIRQATVVALTCALIAACSSARIERHPTSSGVSSNHGPMATEDIDYVVDWIFLHEPLAGKHENPVVLPTAEVERRLGGSSASSLHSGSWDFSSGKPVEAGIGQFGPKGRMHSVNAQVVAVDGDQVTLTFRLGRMGLAKDQTPREVTVSLRRGQAIEMNLDEESGDTLILSARYVAETASELRFLSDLPISGDSLESMRHSRIAEGRNEYPQIFCRMNIIEAEGPLYFTKDNVVGQGSDNGPGHRVQSGDLTEKTFDLFRQLKGYANLSAPTVLALPGHPARIATGTFDASGEVVVRGYDITVQFVPKDGKTDGQLQADVDWKYIGEDGNVTASHHATDLTVDASGAILVVLPNAPDKPGFGRILVVRPVLVRSEVESPLHQGE